MGHPSTHNLDDRSLIPIFSDREMHAAMGDSSFGSISILIIWRVMCVIQSALSIQKKKAFVLFQGKILACRQHHEALQEFGISIQSMRKAVREIRPRAPTIECSLLEFWSFF